MRDGSVAIWTLFQQFSPSSVPSSPLDASLGLFPPESPGGRRDSRVTPLELQGLLFLDHRLGAGKTFPGPRRLFRIGLSIPLLYPLPAGFGLGLPCHLRKVMSLSCVRPFLGH